MPPPINPLNPPPQDERNLRKLLTEGLGSGGEDVEIGNTLRRGGKRGPMGADATFRGKIRPDQPGLRYNLLLIADADRGGQPRFVNLDTLRWVKALQRMSRPWGDPQASHNTIPREERRYAKDATYTTSGGNLGVRHFYPPGYGPLDDEDAPESRQPKAPISELRGPAGRDRFAKWLTEGGIGTRTRDFSEGENMDGLGVEFSAPGRGMLNDGGRWSRGRFMPTGAAERLAQSLGVQRIPMVPRQRFSAGASSTGVGAVNHFFPGQRQRFALGGEQQFGRSEPSQDELLNFKRLNRRWIRMKGGGLARIDASPERGEVGERERGIFVTSPEHGQIGKGWLNIDHDRSSGVNGDEIAALHPFVAPEFRRKGVGTAMYLRAAELARGRAVEPTSQPSAAANKLWESLDWRIDPKQGRQFSRGSQDFALRPQPQLGALGNAQLVPIMLPQGQAPAVGVTPTGGYAPPPQNAALIPARRFALGEQDFSILRPDETGKGRGLGSIYPRVSTGRYGETNVEYDPSVRPIERETSRIQSARHSYEAKADGDVDWPGGQRPIPPGIMVNRNARRRELDPEEWTGTAQPGEEIRQDYFDPFADLPNFGVRGLALATLHDAMNHGLELDPHRNENAVSPLAYAGIRRPGRGGGPRFSLGEQEMGGMPGLGMQQQFRVGDRPEYSGGERANFPSGSEPVRGGRSMFPQRRSYGTSSTDYNPEGQSDALNTAQFPLGDRLKSRAIGQIAPIKPSYQPNEMAKKLDRASIPRDRYGNVARQQAGGERSWGDWWQGLNNGLEDWMKGPGMDAVKSGGRALLQGGVDAIGGLGYRHLGGGVRDAGVGLGNVLKGIGGFPLNQADSLGNIVRGAGGGFVNGLLGRDNTKPWPEPEDRQSQIERGEFLKSQGGRVSQAAQGLGGIARGVGRVGLGLGQGVLSGLGGIAKSLMGDYANRSRQGVNPQRAGSASYSPSDKAFMRSTRQKYSLGEQDFSREDDFGDLLSQLGLGSDIPQVADEPMMVAPQTPEEIMRARATINTAHGPRDLYDMDPEKMSGYLRGQGLLTAGKSTQNRLRAVYGSSGRIQPERAQQIVQGPHETGVAGRVADIIGDLPHQQAPSESPEQRRRRVSGRELGFGLGEQDFGLLDTIKHIGSMVNPVTNYRNLREGGHGRLASGAMVGGGLLGDAMLTGFHPPLVSLGVGRYAQGRAQAADRASDERRAEWMRG